MSLDACTLPELLARGAHDAPAIAAPRLRALTYAGLREPARALAGDAARPPADRAAFPFLTQPAVCRQSLYGIRTE